MVNVETDLYLCAKLIHSLVNIGSAWNCNDWRSVALFHSDLLLLVFVTLALFKQTCFGVSIMILGFDNGYKIFSIPALASIHYLTNTKNIIKKYIKNKTKRLWMWALTLMYVSWCSLARYSMLSSASIPGGVWVKSMAGFIGFCAHKAHYNINHHISI